MPTAEPTADSTTQQAGGRTYLSNGTNAYGYEVSGIDEDTTLFDPLTRSYLVTADNLTPTPEQPVPSTIVRPRFNPTYTNGAKINDGSSSYTVSGSTPIYRVTSGGGRHLIGEQYSLIADNGDVVSATHRLDDNSFTMGTGDELSASPRPQASGNAATTATPIETLIGKTVEYNGAEGVLAHDSNGYYVVDTLSSDSVYVDSGESGASAEVLGVAPKAISLNRPLGSPVSDPLSELQAQIRERTAQANLARRVAEAKREEAAEAARLAKQAELDQIVLADNTFRDSFVNTVTPEMFTDQPAQVMIAKAIATKNSQAVATALESIMYSTARSQQDVATAIRVLSAPAPSGLSTLQLFDMSGTSDAVFEQATQDLQSVVAINGIGSSSILARDAQATGAIADISAIMTTLVTPEDVMRLDNTQLTQLTGVLGVKRLTIPAKQVLIVADITRGSGESYSRAIRRAYQFVQGQTPEQNLSVLEAARDKLDAIGYKLQTDLQRETPAELEAVVARHRELVAQRLSSSVAYLPPADTVIGAEAVLTSNTADQVAMSHPSAPTTGTVRMDTLVDAFRVGFKNPYTRPSQFLSPDSRAKIEGVDEADVYEALLDIQAAGMGRSQDTPEGMDAAYAAGLVEAANIANTQFDLGAPAITEVQLPQQAEMEAPIPSRAKMDDTTALVLEGAILSLANQPALNVINGVKVLKNDLAETTRLMNDYMEGIVAAEVTLPANEQVQLASQFTRQTKAEAAVEYIRAQLAAVGEAHAQLEATMAAGRKDNKFDAIYAATAAKRHDLEAALANAEAELATLTEQTSALVDSKTEYKLIGDLSQRLPTEAAETSPNAIGLMLMTTPTSDPSIIINDLIGVVATAYDSNLNGGQLYDRAYQDAVDSQAAKINEAGVLPKPYKPKKATKLNAATKGALDAAGNLARQEIPFDALDRITRTTDPETILASLAAIDAVTGSRTLEGIANYNTSGTSGFLPKSALDGFNFSGVYKTLDNIEADANTGLLSTQQVRDIASSILQQVPLGRSRDRAIAEALLHATGFARTQRAQNNPPLNANRVRYANTTPTVQNHYMNSADATLEVLMESSSFRDALLYISQNPTLSRGHAAVIRALAEMSSRFLGDITVNIDPTAPREASFDWSTYTITLNGGTHAHPYSVVHEFVHALVDTLFNADESQLTARQLEAKQALLDLYTYAKQNGAVTAYSSTDVREWLAESMSDGAQADMLHNLDTRGLSFLDDVRSAYDYFVNKLRDLFDLIGWAAARNINLPAEEMNTALTDIVAILHVYSKPTSKQAMGTKEERAAGQTGGKAATPATEYAKGYQNLHSVMLYDRSSPVGYRLPSGFIRKIGPARFELVIHDVYGTRITRQVGTMPKLLAEVDKHGGRYDLATKIQVVSAVNTDVARHKGASKIEFTNPANPTTPAGYIREVSAGNYELVDINSAGTAVPRTKGDLGYLVALLTNSGIGYTFASDAVKPANVKLDTTWSVPQRSVGAQMLDYALVPRAFRPTIIKYIDELVSKQIAINTKAGNNFSGDLEGLPFTLRLLDVYLTGSKFLRMLPRRSNAFEIVNEVHAANTELESDLSSTLDIEQFLNKRRGMAANYSGGRNGYLNMQRAKILSYLKSHGLGEDAMGFYVNAKRAIELNEGREGIRQTGTMDPNRDWSGLSYAGKKGTDAANAILAELAARGKIAALEAAWAPLRDLNHALLDLEFKAGILTRDQWYAYKNDPYYAPLWNAKRDDTTRETSDHTIQGRSSQPANGYVSLFESMRDRYTALTENEVVNALVEKLGDIRATGAVSISPADLKSVFDPVLKREVMRLNPTAYNDTGSRVFYKEGKPFLLVPNEKHPLGRYLHAQFANEDFDKWSNPTTWGIRHIATGIKELTNIISLGATLFNIKFHTITPAWALEAISSVTQSAYKVDGKTGALITGRTYAQLAALGGFKGSLAHAMALGSDPIHELYLRGGGGMAGFGIAGNQLLRSDNVLSHYGALSQRKKDISLLSDPASLGAVFPNPLSARATAVTSTVKNWVHDFAELTNVVDQTARYASWRAALETLGTPDMRAALESGDATQLSSLLAQDPALDAQLISGSKEVLGNFQAKSSLNVLGPFFPFFEAAMSGTTMATRTLATKQGVAAGMILFLAAMGLAFHAFEEDDDVAPDGTSNHMNDPARAEQPTIAIGNKIVRLPMEHSLRVPFAMGHYTAAVASNRLSLLEAMAGLRDVAKASHSPVQFGNTGNVVMDVAWGLTPDAVDSLAGPMMGYTRNSSENFNKKPAFAANGELIKDPRFWELGGKYQLSTDVSKALGVETLTPRTLEAMTSNLGGASYGALLAAEHGGEEALQRRAISGYVRPDNVTFNIKNKFDDMREDVAVRYRDAQDSMTAASPELRGITKANEILVDAEAASKRVTITGGYNFGAIINGRRNATTDLEKQTWINREQQMYEARAKVLGAAMQEATAIIKAVDNGTYSSMTWRSPLREEQANVANALRARQAALTEQQNALIKKIEDRIK